MSDSSVHIPLHIADRAMVTLISAAGPQEWDRAIASRPRIVRAVLDGHVPVPAAFAEEALRGGDEESLISLLKAHERVQDMPDVLDRLAATGRARLYRHHDRRFQTRLLASAHLDRAGWAAMDLSRWVTWMRPEDEVRTWRLYVHSRLPALLRGTLERVGHLLSDRERALALWNLHAAAGREAAEAWFERVGGVVGEKAAAEVADGGDLSALAAWAESTELAVAELRDTGSGDRAQTFGAREVLDWDVLRAAHREEPFDVEAAGLLAGREGCPEDFLAELYEAHPGAVVDNAARPDRAWWALRPSGSAAVVARASKVLAGRLVAEGEPEGVLAEARPAVAVLEALRTSRERHAENTAALMDELTAPVARLGADPARWRALRAALKSAKGLTVLELFAKAESMAAAGKAPAAWPDAADVPPEGKATSLTGARSAFVPLFDVAAVEVQLALLPHLDGRTRHEVFTLGAWRPEWLDAALAGPDRGWCLSLAARASLSTPAIQRLLELDDSEINARLFLRSQVSNLQRTAILSGRRFGGGEGPVPLDPGLRGRLLTRDGGWRGTDAIDCADAELQTHILAKVRVRGEMPQTRLLVEAWDRHGRELAAKYVAGDIGPKAYSAHPIGPGLKKRFTALLKLDDPSAELARLREEARESLTAEWQIGQVRADRSDHFDLAKHSHHWHWDELVAAHREEPFSPWMIKGFDSETAGCPTEFKADSEELGPNPEVGETWEDRILSSGDVLRRLEAPLSVDYQKRHWLGSALARGAVSPGDVLAVARPAAVALAVVNTRGADAVSKLLAETVAGDPDVWMLVLGMLPDFAGSLPELLDTARLAVG
ncbi:hypothetical protein AB0I28_08175 [Phytomonospora sp. NPDC050363]|uniref:hypothetical protein n=1 Tax=Phytomonospora sp. NPDC050363 TaxID=3155642 RepID=UPI0033F5CDD1